MKIEAGDRFNWLLTINDCSLGVVSGNNKGINNIEYNFLNLPILIKFDDIDRDVAGNQPGKIEWTYTTSGSKLRKTVYVGNQISSVKDYAGGFVYADGSLEFFHMDEGRAYNNCCYPQQRAGTKCRQDHYN